MKLELSPYLYMLHYVVRLFCCCFSVGINDIGAKCKTRPCIYAYVIFSSLSLINLAKKNLKNIINIIIKLYLLKYN